MSPFAATSPVLAWLGTYLVHSTLLLGAAWLVCRRLAGRHLLAEEAIWRAAMFGAIATASLQVGLGWHPLGGSFAFDPTMADARPPIVALPATPAARGSVAVPALASRELPRRAIVMTVAPAPAPRRMDAVIAALPSLWAAVAIALLVRLSLAHGRLRLRIRVRPQIVGGTMFRALERLRAVVGHAPGVRLTCAHRLGVPIAFGVVHGEIAVPPRALSHLDPDEQESLLAHELAHLVRRDPLALALTQIVAAALFFQPLNWIARSRLRAISELLADEWAVGRTGRPISLARCLAEVACWSLPEARVPVPAMAEAATPLGARIRRLLGPLRPTGRLPRWSLPALAVALAAFAAVAPAVSARRAESAHRTAAAAPEQARAAAPREPYREAQPAGTYVMTAPSRDEMTEDEMAVADQVADLAFDAADLAAPMAAPDVAAALAELEREAAPTFTPEQSARLEVISERIAELSKPDPEALERLGQVAGRLADGGLSEEERRNLRAEIARLTAGIRPDGEELRRLTAELHTLIRPTIDREHLREAARRFAEEHRPSEEQLRALRDQAREYSRRAREVVERHREQIEEAQREARRALEEVRRELERDLDRDLGPELEGLRRQSMRPPRPPRAPRPVVAPAPRASVAPAPSPVVAPSPRVAPAPPSRRRHAPSAPALAPPAPRPTPAPRAEPAPTLEPALAPAPDAPVAPDPEEPVEPPIAR